MSTVWLDGYGFARRVICAGREPWHDPAQMGAVYRDLQKLLPVDLQVLPLSPLFESLLSRMGDAFFSVDAFDGLIRQRHYSDALSTALESMWASGLGARIALSAPGPGFILKGNDAIDFDDADRVLAGICESVRICGDRISAVLIHEDRDDALEPADAVVNVARHSGLQSALATGAELPANSALFAPIFSRSAVAASPWLGGDWFHAPYAFAAAGDVLLSPPEDCAPEVARNRLAMVRGAA